MFPNINGHHDVVFFWKNFAFNCWLPPFKSSMEMSVKLFEIRV